MALNYERVGWENAPSTATPIDAGNLNHMDNGILAVSKQYDTDIPNLIDQVAAIPAMLDSYLAEEIGTDVTNWLNEHVTPGGSTIVVDDTLSVSGAAADSKTVGDALGTKASQSDVEGLEQEVMAKADAEDLNEAVGDISQLETALTAVEIVDAASGAIASFTDGSDGVPVRDLKVQMEPIQDLHGYDHPWPAGGGKNKFDFQIASPTKTENGITFTVNDDGSVTMNGTATGQSQIYWMMAADDVHQFSGMLLDCFPEAVPGVGVLLEGERAPYTSYAVQTSGSSTPVTISSSIEGNENYANLIIRVVSGTTISNKKVYPMIRPVDSQSGYAPYSNICPISGRDSVTVTRTGVNIWDEEWESGYYLNESGELHPTTNAFVSKNYIHCFPSTSYYFKNVHNVCFYDESKNFINRVFEGTSVATTPSNAHYMKFDRRDSSTYSHDISINYPSTDTDYHAGHVQTVEIPLGQTVYGGTLEVTHGLLTVDRALVDLGTLGWFYDSTNSTFTSTEIKGNRSGTPFVSSIYLDAGAVSISVVTDMQGILRSNALYLKNSSYTDAATFKAAMSGVQLCYELAQPVTVQLTAQQMTTLLGQNNVWSDADSVAVDYVADTKLYITKVIADALN